MWPPGAAFLIGLDSFDIQVVDPTAGKATAVHVNFVPDKLVIAPGGTPHAGRVYGVGSRFVEILDPTAAAPRQVAVQNSGSLAAVAPAGSADAGDLYTVDYQTKTLNVLDGDAHPTRSVSLGELPFTMNVTPSGVPNAGTVVVTGDAAVGGTTFKMTLVPPGGKQPITVPLAGPESGLAIAPAGSAAPGSIYVSTNDPHGSLQVFSPAGHLERTLALGTTGDLKIAPDGTLYMGGNAAVDPISGKLSPLPSGGGALVIQPAEAPNPGALFYGPENGGPWTYLANPQAPASTVHIPNDDDIHSPVPASPHGPFAGGTYLLTGDATFQPISASGVVGSPVELKGGPYDTIVPLD